MDIKKSYNYNLHMGRNNDTIRTYLVCEIRRSKQCVRKPQHLR